MHTAADAERAEAVRAKAVLAADGRLTGYHWGLDRKRAMLAYEAATG